MDRAKQSALLRGKRIETVDEPIDLIVVLSKRYPKTEK